jgi:hypothetical protein
MSRAREIAAYVLLAAVIGLAAGLEDPTPALVPLVAAVILMPWRDDMGRRPRRWTRRDLVAFLVMLVALALTLLIPDGIARALIIIAIVSAYLASWRILDPDR